MTDEPAGAEKAPMTLFAFVKRKEGMSHEEFLDYWRNHHGPLIRDTPVLRAPVLHYEQHGVHPSDGSGFDGVAMETYTSWEDFLAVLDTPEGQIMRDDEANFLDSSSIKVVFTADRVIQIDGLGREVGP
jgi:uncharacterized protein (TIGR02118 family)